MGICLAKCFTHISAPLRTKIPFRYSRKQQKDKFTQRQRQRERLTGTAKRQRKNGNGMVETGHKTYKLWRLSLKLPIIAAWVGVRYSRVRNSRDSTPFGPKPNSRGTPRTTHVRNPNPNPGIADLGMVSRYRRRCTHLHHRLTMSCRRCHHYHSSFGV